MAKRREDLWGATGRNISTAYKNLRDADSRGLTYLRDHIDRLWAQYGALAERNFVQGFAHDPDARLWEMALGCHFSDLGKGPLSEIPKDVAGPDLCLPLGDNGGHVWVEAVCPQNAENDLDKVPMGQSSGFMPVREVQLRLVGALRAKQKACDGYVADQRCPVHPADPIVIAVSTGRFAGMGALGPVPGFAGCVLPTDGERWVYDFNTDELTFKGLRFSKSILKSGPGEPEGVPIERAAFLLEDFAGISGVIFSRYGLWCGSERPRLSFFHNPNARNPLPPKWAEWNQEFVTHLREDGTYLLEELSKRAQGR